MAETIAAISTPVGEGGIGIIRISGDKALQIADKCFKAFSGEKLTEMSGYRAAYGEIIYNGEVLDDGVATVFRAPKSYTGEDVAELSVHSGRIVIKKVLRAVFDLGARPALSGEFTKRAFLNGKLDLAKAESIMGIISASSESAYKISRAAKNGSISKKTEEITSKLLETAASLAAYSDYPDEDIPGLDTESFLKLLSQCDASLKNLLSTYDTGKAIREGIDCAIVGKPNVGKSTLMNMLCRSERSIVTDIAGTTRDIIENTVVLGDIPLILADTAGIRNTNDTVEKFGVDRALERIETAGIVLAVFDSSSALDDDDERLLNAVKGKKTVIVLNKTDLETKINKSAFAEIPYVEISAKDGKGLDVLTKAVSDIIGAALLDSSQAVLISERQRSCVQTAYNAVCEAKQALISGITLDAVGVCVDDAVAALLELTGKRVTNEVTDEVFKRFCVGK